MAQYNPYQAQPPTAPRQNKPSQIIPKTNWLSYTITVIVAFVILILLNWVFLSAANFISLTSFTTLYIFIAIISLIIGLLSSLILNKIAKSNKSFLLGVSIISFLSAAVVSSFLSMQKIVAEQLVGLESSPGGAGLGELFGTAPNPLLTGFLIIIFFNIIPLIIFFRKEEKLMKDLLIYLYSFIIFLIVYFVIPLILT